MSQTKLQVCICCGNARPIATQFSVNSPICIHCETLNPSDVALKTLETTTITWRLRTQTKEGRKQARIDRKLATYAEHGKRCASCHSSKPIAEYGACAPASDGLQAVCKQCARTRTVLCAHGNRSSWYTYRDAMRAKAKVTQTTA